MAKEKIEISFEEQIAKAKEILEKLSKPDITLGEGLRLYKEGMEELKSAQKKLEDAKLEFESIKNREVEAQMA